MEIPEEKYNVHFSVKEEHWIGIDLLQKCNLCGKAIWKEAEVPLLLNFPGHSPLLFLDNPQEIKLQEAVTSTELAYNSVYGSLPLPGTPAVEISVFCVWPATKMRWRLTRLTS